MSLKREYTAISKVGTEVLEMLRQGKTQQEVAEHFGFRNKYVVKDFVKRHNRGRKKAEAGIPPVQKDVLERAQSHQTPVKKRTMKSNGLRWKMNCCGIFFAPLEGSEAICQI